MPGAGVARRRPYEVGYMKLTQDNLAEVAAWCGGEVDDEIEPTCVLVPTMHGQVPAFPGDNVVGGRVDFYPISDDQLATGYEIEVAAS